MIKKIDHLVITTNNIEACLLFYKSIGFTIKDGSGRCELFAGDFKINVHILRHELFPHAENIQTGSVDLCFETTDNIHKLKAEFETKGIVVELGVVGRSGTKGNMKSFYLRDPDGNLIEFCNYH